MEAGEVYDNTVDNILARLKTFQWQQGAKVSVYPKKLRANEINIQMTLPTGNVGSLTGYESDFNLMGGLLLSGSSKYNKEQIASKLDELKASINVSTRKAGEILITIKALKSNLNDTLAFTSELLTNPKFDQEEIEINRQATTTYLEKTRNEPGNVSYAALKEAFSGYSVGHPLAYRDIDTKISSLEESHPKTLKGPSRRSHEILIMLISLLSEMLIQHRFPLS